MSLGLLLRAKLADLVRNELSLSCSLRQANAVKPFYNLSHPFVCSTYSYAGGPQGAGSGTFNAHPSMVRNPVPLRRKPARHADKFSRASSQLCILSLDVESGAVLHCLARTFWHRLRPLASARGSRPNSLLKDRSNLVEARSAVMKSHIYRYLHQFTRPDAVD